jgi:hypothetical protein
MKAKTIELPSVDGLMDVFEKPKATSTGNGHEVEYKPPGSLKPYERNANKHSADQIALIAKSIEQFGFTIPVLCDENDLILAGHGRQMAALQMNLALVPVIHRRGLSEAQKRAYIMADNQIARTSEFDFDLIAQELQSLAHDYADFDLGVIGFGDDEVKKFLDPMFGKQAPDTGALLEVLRVSLDDPKHKVEHGHLWDAAGHVVACLDVFTEWEKWISELQPGSMLVPYGGPLVLLSERAKSTRLVIVNPQAHICGMILDKCVEGGLGKPKRRP